MAGEGSSDQSRLFCRNCGRSVGSEDTFCSYCGEHLGPEAGTLRTLRQAPTGSRNRASEVFSRLWPANAGREILAGILVAVVVAGLLLGLIYAVLALRGAFADPSAPRTLGLVIFSLIHGGALYASVPAGPSLFGIGGSLDLGLPVTSFALLPFVTLLVLGRVVARRTETTVLFACVTAATYALVVSLLAALGAASVEEAGQGVVAQVAADPLSTAWRAFLLAMLAVLVGSAVSHGPLLPMRPRQVIRGALAAMGISLAVTLLLAVILFVVQVGGDAGTPQLPQGLPTQSAPGDSSIGGPLATVGVLFALLPAVLGTLWLFAHGLPIGLQGAQDLTTLPLIGSALADLPLRVSLLGNWPGGIVWRLLLLGPVVGLVAGGMLAARGAPRNERWWQGALMVVPYAAFAALAAVLCRITAEISVAVLTLDLTLGASLPWLLALLPVGGALGALGGLLAKSETVWGPNPRRTFLATAIVSAIVLVVSLPGAIALPSPGTSELAGSDLPQSEPSPKTPATASGENTTVSSYTPNTTESSDSSDTSPDPAFARLLPPLRQMTTAPIMLPAELPPQLKNVAIAEDPNGTARYTTSGDTYTILFRSQPPEDIVQPYVHALSRGTLTASREPMPTNPPQVSETSRGTVELPDGTEATLTLQEAPGTNMGTISVGTFEKDGWTYTLSLQVGEAQPADVTEQVLSTMVSASQSEKPDSENAEASEAGLRRAAADYYEAVERKDWGYTYDNLDSQTQRRFTRSGWIRKNQDFDGIDPLVRSTPKITGEVSTSSPVEVTLTQVFGSGTTGSRTTYFIWEDGSWKHRFSQEEYDLFLGGTS